MNIAGYLQTSLIEWPGKVAAVIFTAGCNFRCPFCHNADLVDPKKVKKLKLIDGKDILADLKKRKKWIDGVVITGGEPTMQKDLPGFCRKIKKLGFKIKIETNGSNPEMVKKFIKRKLVDEWNVDFKVPWRQYKKLDIRNKIESGSNKLNVVEKIKKSILMILKSKSPLTIKTTIVPGIHDREVLLKMTEEIERLLTSHCSLLTAHWFFQNFQPKNTLNSKFMKIKPFSEKEFEDLVSKTRKRCRIIKIQN